MNEEKDFFKTCFNTVAGIEVKNESQAIAKEVVLSEIKRLEQENKILKENAENNDKVVDKVNWENMLLKKENEQLKESYSKLEGKYFANVPCCNENDCDLYRDYMKLKDNWNKLKEYIRKNIIYDDVGMKILDPSPLEDYIQELEQGSD